MAQDYYQILGVDKSASDAQLKKAYRKLAQEYHPDKKGGDEKKFKELNEAYDVLSDAKKRQAYDQFGEAPFRQGGQGGFNPNDFRAQYGGFPGGSQGVNFDFGQSGFDFGDIFGSMFGREQPSAKQNTRRGSDLETELRISLEDAFNGVTKELALQKHVRCDRCGGDGNEPGSSFTTCPTCQGSGQVRSVRQSVFGQAVSEQVCPQCAGKGKIASTKCRQCNGRGFVQAVRTYQVKIPRGAKDGSKIRFRGEGEIVEGSSLAGDLVVNIKLEKHWYFERIDDNLSSLQEIDYPTAVLGGKIRVRVIDGEIELKIPPGTQADQVIKIKGKGMPLARGGGRGDHLVKIGIRIPGSLTNEQRELLQAHGKSRNEPHLIR